MVNARANQNVVDTGIALMANGRLDEASSKFETVLARCPDHQDARHGLACVARARGLPQQAIALLGPLLRENIPDVPRALYHITLGHALFEAGHVEAARAAFSVATILAPNDFRAHAGLGEMLLRQGNACASEGAWERCFMLASDPIPHRQRYAEILMGARAFNEAAAQFDIIARSLSNNGYAWANLGAACFEAGQMSEALHALSKAVELGAGTAETLMNRSLVALAIGQFTKAQQDMDKAVALRPHDRRIRNNAATVLHQTGRIEEAERIYAALMQGDDFESVRAAYNLATLRLAQGRMREGWRLFEARHAVLGWQPALPIWDGSVQVGPVMIVSEQGAGDFIQFLRYLPEALLRAPIVLEVEEALRPIINLMPVLRHHLRSGRLSFCGISVSVCRMMSLPGILNRAEPDPSPYLQIKASNALDCEMSGGMLRVGICWKGASRYRFDQRRSIGTSLMADIFNVSEVLFVDLHHGDGRAIDHGHNMEAADTSSWLSTSAELMLCDIVISVDTAVAHLAGALGCQVWLLDRFGGDWRWQGPPWYQNVTVIRAEFTEPPESAWKPVIAEVSDRLAQHAARQHRG